MQIRKRTIGHEVTYTEDGQLRVKPITETYLIDSLPKRLLKNRKFREGLLYVMFYISCAIGSLKESPWVSLGLAFVAGVYTLETINELIQEKAK